MHGARHESGRLPTSLELNFLCWSNMCIGSTQRMVACFRRDAIKLEMVKVGTAFEVLEEGVPALPGWHKVTGHSVLDVKMDFTRRARSVLDGHKTPDPVYNSTYAGVVSRESVKNCFYLCSLEWT